MYYHAVSLYFKYLQITTSINKTSIDYRNYLLDQFFSVLVAWSGLEVHVEIVVNFLKRKEILKEANAFLFLSARFVGNAGVKWINRPRQRSYSTGFRQLKIYSSRLQAFIIQFSTFKQKRIHLNFIIRSIFMSTIYIYICLCVEVLWHCTKAT